MPLRCSVTRYLYQTSQGNLSFIYITVALIKTTMTVACCANKSAPSLAEKPLKCLRNSKTISTMSMHLLPENSVLIIFFFA